MALEDAAPEDQTPAAPQPGDPSAPLQDFRDAFTHPEAQAWAGEVTTRLNDYFQRRQIADEANATGQQFVQDVDQFKSGLVNMVKADPSAVHTALDIVPPTMGALISNVPGGPPADAEDHHNALVGHMQAEIAAAAITSAAETNTGVAKALLANDRIAGVLGDGAQHLGTYIDMQAAARERDAAAARGQNAVAQAEIADKSARNYIGAMVDPNTGKPRSPPGWNQAVMADDSVPPADKVALFNAHEQLGRNGDAETDPHVAMDLVNRAANGQATQRDVYPHLGARVSLADADTLIGAIRSPTYIRQINDTIQSARQVIAPDGDIAQTRALGRYVSWMLPQLRTGAPVDPMHESWVGQAAPAFQVNGDDLVARPVQPNRPSLGQIFAGNELRPLPMNPGPADSVLNRPVTPMEQQDRFFTRKLEENPIQPLQVNPKNKGNLGA